MNKLLILIIALVCSGCATSGAIDVPKRMSQAQQQGKCVLAAVYEETEEGEYVKTHKFMMICK